MPDRTPALPYDGPERRKADRRAEDMHPRRYGRYSKWQWGVILSFAAMFVALVLSAAVYGLARRADENARRGNAAICVQVKFLENAERTTREVIARNPDAPEIKARLRSAEELHGLVMELREEIPSCRDALR